MAWGRWGSGSGDVPDGLDVEALRDCIRDYYGTAVVGGFPMALADLANVDSMSASELLDSAHELGIDVRRFMR